MADSFHSDVWERKYYALLRRCKQIERENGKIVNRINHCKRYTKRLEKERRFLKQKLDEYGDDYQNSQPPHQIKLLEELEMAEQIEKNDLVGLMGLNSNSPSVSGTSGSKKGKNKAVSKPDKEKDPNAPKRPANAFFMFCQQQRTAMQEDQKDTSMGHHELTKSLAKEWNNLIPEEKQAYYKMYELDKTRYEQEMKLYAQDKGTSGTVKKEGSKKSKSNAGKGTSNKSRESLALSESLMADHLMKGTLSHVMSASSLNPLSPQSLNTVPFNIQNLPSPNLSNADSVFPDISAIP